MVHIPSTPIPRHIGMVRLPPPPKTTHIVTPAVNSTYAGIPFQNLGSRRNHNISTDEDITLEKSSGFFYG